MTYAAKLRAQLDDYDWHGQPPKTDNKPKPRKFYRKPVRRNAGSSGPLCLICRLFKSINGVCDCNSF